MTEDWKNKLYFGDNLKILRVSVLLPELRLHLHICISRQFVIFHDITGFERRGFLHIISMCLY